MMTYPQFRKIEYYRRRAMIHPSFAAEFWIFTLGVEYETF